MQHRASTVGWLGCVTLIACGNSGSSPAAGSGGSNSTTGGQGARDAGNLLFDGGQNGAADSGVPIDNGDPSPGPHGGSGSSPKSGSGGSHAGGTGSSANGGAYAADGGTVTSQAGDGAGGGGGTSGSTQAGSGDTGSGGAGGSSGSLCSGPSPAATNTSQVPMAIDTASPGRNAPGARTTPDAPAPLYRLSDFQQLSCGTSKNYGLDSFRGHPTIVGLFASWCPYCLEQAPMLQQMQLELQAEQNKMVYVVIINASPENSPGHDPIGDQYNLTSRVDYPILQDQDDVKAWDLHGGFKDDLFIYRSDGTLQAYLSTYQGVLPNIDLTTNDGYAAVKAVVAGTP